MLKNKKQADFHKLTCSKYVSNEIKQRLIFKGKTSNMSLGNGYATDDAYPFRMAGAAEEPTVIAARCIVGS